jgi:hypothetical protein
VVGVQIARGGVRCREARIGEQEGVAPLSAGGTLYSDEREILDAERDYWQPRVAVHFGAKLLKWAMFDFGQGIPRVLVVLNPTARKQALRALDMRATVDREEFFAAQHGDGRLKLIERLGRRLPCRRAPRLHARVRRLAEDAGEAIHFLSHRTAPNELPALSPRPVPKIRGRRQPALECPFPATFGPSCHWPKRRAPPYQGGARANRPRLPFAGSFRSTWTEFTLATLKPLLDQEGLGNREKGTFCRYLSPLPDSNRGPPPYHGGFDCGYWMPE